VTLYLFHGVSTPWYCDVVFGSMGKSHVTKFLSISAADILLAFYAIIVQPISVKSYIETFSFQIIYITVFLSTREISAWYIYTISQILSTHLRSLNTKTRISNIVVVYIDAVSIYIFSKFSYKKKVHLLISIR
jgi:hypothetical protein